MANKPKLTLVELRANPPKFTPEQRARLDAMSQNEIDANADADDINPTWTDKELTNAVFARAVRLAREKAGMTQPVFAERFHIKLSRLRDWERARYAPDTVSAAYIRTILFNPELVEQALETDLKEAG